MKSRYPHTENDPVVQEKKRSFSCSHFLRPEISVFHEDSLGRLSDPVTSALDSQLLAPSERDGPDSSVVVVELLSHVQLLRHDSCAAVSGPSLACIRGPLRPVLTGSQEAPESHPPWVFVYCDLPKFISWLPFKYDACLLSRFSRV